MTGFSRVRSWLPLLPLLALLGVAYWLNLQVLPESIKQESRKRHDPDAIVENFSAVNLDKSGEPHFIMAARKMLHYPDDDSTVLEAPHITILSTELPKIQATAKRGTISSKGDEIFLQDDVQVLREANSRLNELTLRTEYLHILPEQNLTNTDQAITVTDEHSTLHAVGLEMDNKARTIKLISKVDSEYVANKK